MTYDEFYAMYPRKLAQAHGRVMWDRLTEEEKKLAAEALPNHIKMWHARGDKEFIPHVGTWLNPVMGRRWEDEIEMPEAKQPDWWRSEMGIARRAKELCISARPGESTNDFIGRLRAATNEPIPKMGL